MGFHHGQAHGILYPLAVYAVLGDLHIPQASTPQPMMKAAPPRGVSAPNPRIPLSDSPYKLPENSTIPPVNSQPTARVRMPE
jgi:hypothetical protein